MKKIAALLFLVFVGCNQKSNHLAEGPTGTEWSGLFPDGHQKVTMLLMDGAAPSQLKITNVNSPLYPPNTVVMSATLSGGISPQGQVSFTADEGVACTDKWMISGLSSGNSMSVGLVGNGNIGVGCYPYSLNISVNLYK